MRTIEVVCREELIDIVSGLDLWSDRVPGAIALAESVHAHQRRAGGGPYLEEHVFPVTANVACFLAGHERPAAKDAVIVALLHDTIEDSTTVGEEMIEAQFGEAIARRVAILTKPAKRSATSEGHSEDEESRYAASVRAADFVTRTVKVLDRLNNLAAVHEREPERRRRYLDETRMHYIELAESVDRSLAALMRDLLSTQLARFTDDADS